MFLLYLSKWFGLFTYTNDNSQVGSPNSKCRANKTATKYETDWYIFYGFIVRNVCQYVQNQPTVVCLKLHVLVSIVCILPIQTYPTFLHRTTGMCIGLATVEISLIKFCTQPYGTKYELYLDNKMTKIQRVGD